MFRQTTDDDSASDEEQTTPTWKRKGLNCGKLHTADTLVLKRIIWPHKVVYTSTGQPVIYKGKSSIVFVNGYLTVMAEE